MRGFGVRELLGCYARGVFPMAESRDDPRIFLLEPDERGVIPLDAFHIPRSLRRTVRRDVYHVTANRSFETVLRSCAAAAPGREDTWINDPIASLYLDLHRAGHAHSIECWREGALAGGLYGVTLGSAFFGESMFSRQTDASKTALVHLVARLKAGGFTLLDAQFLTAHLERFGAVAVTRRDYKAMLAEAAGQEADFFALPEGLPGAQLLQSITQTS
ncbi:leucyl/phenylalanyl-tRNA--protein transferase [Alkalicaulis satelles]|uniref:Leucyl/phenylalanyl-tRNA--protein transferase n=1 Tax=Alkalicaulis satelles TaxID=2609175 RepID=A0A5M6ZCV8_9PROT|nr:leucyl/phenylalanyl-tRNA--protein transferase [Alkalicaulis satelles]KAA5801734.1 leucyl/phenylalanyl-tRNA--protein transferase [Alkalicaulis satelles]